MNEIKVLGTEEIDGQTFVGIEGGFGEGKRSMLVRDIAEAHGVNVKRLNENIERNRKRFKDGVEIINLKNNSVVAQNDLKKMGFSQQAINRSSNIYLLSERGYSKLLKIMDSDAAWEQYDKFVDGYFQYRKAATQTKPMSATDQLRLATKSVVELDDRVTELENNAALSPTDYTTIGTEVSRRVHAYAKLHHIADTGALFKDLNGQIKQVTGAGNRSRIKAKDYDMVIEFISNWTPTTATLTLVKQTELEV